MSDNRAKVISTFFLLGAGVAISNQAMNTPINDGDAVLAIVVGLLAMLLFGMSIIWVVPERMNARYGRGTEDQFPEKGKRGSRREEQMALLMDLMDDEELVTFKESLKRRVLADPAYEDGELPFGEDTLESLLEDSGWELRQHGA